MGTLGVYAKTNSQERKLLVEIKGDIGNEWRLMQVDLDITEVFKVTPYDGYLKCGWKLLVGFFVKNVPGLLEGNV